MRRTIPRYTLSQWIELTGIVLTRPELVRLSSQVSRKYRVYNETPPVKITYPSPNTGRYTNRAYGYSEDEFFILEEAYQELRVSSMESSRG